MLFLTGGTGFLGSYILAELVQKGYAVRALQRNRGIPAHLPKEIAEKVEWVSGDILDVGILGDYLKDCDRIIHSAGLISFNPGDRHKLFKVNIEGTANLVNAALENNIRDFVYISSVAALGITDGRQPVNEEKKWEGLSKLSNYAVSKYYAEMEVWRGMAEGLTPLILNPSIVIGYGDWNEGSCAIFKSVYDEFPWYTRGSSGYVDVGDLARTVVSLMESSVRNEKFIVSAENWSFRHLFDRIADGFGKNHPSKEATPLLAALAWRMEKIKSAFNGKQALLTRETAALASRNCFYDNGKLLKSLPGFQFKPMEDTIRNACSLYLQNLQPV